MAFVDDREDINSVCLTAVQRLLDNYGIDPKSVGRLEVGTESLVDKSKSTKTTLMRLFEGSGNVNMEGATVVNACYGGTAAFLNSTAWMESSEWDGRYAIFVAADIAVYEKGVARPTGGVGAVAMLVGPDAPLRLLPRCRATHAVDVYDFYKPSMSSEYPAVDGKLSQTCYLKAVDDCYTGHFTKLERSGALAHRPLPNGGLATVDTAYDYMLFHSPYNKLVQQSYRRMLFNDARRLTAAGVPLPAHLTKLAPFMALPHKDTLTNKDLDKVLASVGTEQYEKAVAPSVGFSQNIGNSYTAALWCNLLSLVDRDGAAVEGHRLGMFSYGSGALATMFGMDAPKHPHSTRVNPKFSLGGMQAAANLSARLATRREASPEEFTEALAMRERAYGKAQMKPAGSIDNVPAGAWYLHDVGANYVRHYSRKH